MTLILKSVATENCGHDNFNWPAQPGETCSGNNYDGGDDDEDDDDNDDDNGDDDGHDNTDSRWSRA